MATVSLGAPQTLEIFQYLAESDPSPPLTGSNRSDVFGGGLEDIAEGVRPGGRGRPIATTPMGCVYLEPRSLFISRKAIYETFLHGISPIEEDVFEVGSGSGDEGRSRLSLKLRGVEMANSACIESSLRDQLQHALDAGEKELVVKRGTRVSLTFRRVEKVLQGGLGVGVLGRGSAGAKR